VDVQELKSIALIIKKRIETVFFNANLYTYLFKTPPNGLALSLPRNVFIRGCGTDKFQVAENEISSR